MENIFAKICVVALGGAAGSVARYLVAVSPITTLFGKFPSHTFFVNVLGSFLIGFFLIFFTEKYALGENIRLLIVVGFLGAFTTFSTFELEIWELINKNRYTLTFLYLFSSVLIGFIGLLLGIWLARKF